jgi:hypothetical protein
METRERKFRDFGKVLGRENYFYFVEFNTGGKTYRSYEMNYQALLEFVNDLHLECDFSNLVIFARLVIYPFSEN